MLERTPRTALDGLTDALAFGLRSETQSKFDQQLKLFCGWFSMWTDSQRNAMLNSLEAVDQLRVDLFVERFSRIRW
jgi:hypothetical protein